jgi:hypothetical protein
MLSIIICSINQEQLAAILQNISETVGVPYEVIAIDNTFEPQGLTRVYNQGVNKAIFEHICFVHEDVKFLTPGWGLVLLNLFKDNKLGLVGVAGSKYKPKTPSGWRPGIRGKFLNINLIQHFKYQQQPVKHFSSNIENERLSQVACIDGVFMASKKSILEETPFDEKMLKGFHGYDIDISIAIGRRYKVAVSYDILLEHFSEGNLNQEWVKDTISLHEKWADVLPIAIGKVSRGEMIRCERRSFRNLLKICAKYVSPEQALYAIKLSGMEHLSYVTYIGMYMSLYKQYFLGLIKPAKKNVVFKNRELQKA